MAPDEVFTPNTYPHICIVPGVLITVTVLAFNLLDDGLRDALDPRLKV